MVLLTKHLFFKKVEFLIKTCYPEVERKCEGQKEVVKMKEIEECLWQLTVPDLQKHCKKLGIKSGSIKQDTIKNILEFYSQEGWFEEYFETLEGFDKEYTELIVKENFVPISSEVRELRKKYNKKMGWYYENDDDLKFCLNGFVPEIFREKLLTLVPPIQVEFKETKKTVDIDECYDSILSEENPMQKFDDFIMFITENKVKVTEKNNSLTKGSILKYCDKYNIKEITRHKNGQDEEPKNQNDTIIVNGIVTLLLAANIIKIKEGYLVLGKDYQEYIQLNKIEKAKYLLQKYINSDISIINETKRLTNYVYKVNERINLKIPREKIIAYLKKFPIDAWIETHDLKYMFRVKDIYFLREHTGEVLQKSDYSNWYDNAYYNDFEWEFIDSVLMDYLAVLGIVDVTIIAFYNEIYRYCFDTNFIKLTSFGAMVLDLVESNVEEGILKPFIINDHFEIIIEESAKRLEYELYFERFLSKIEQTKEYSIYELSFTGLANAFDLGMNPKDIITYIKKESKGIPDKVLEEINAWLQTLNKVTIKTVTILEAPREIMTVLANNAKINTWMEQSKNEHIIIKKGKSKEIKKQVEKNNCFCKITE